MTGGVATALDEVADQLADGAGLVQAALFDAEEIGALDAPSPLSGAIEPRRRGPGRPKGAKNRRTEAVAGWLLSQGRHPVLVMMEAYGMAPADLADRIGLRRVNLAAEGEPPVMGYADETLIELYRLQLRMAESAAPYVAQKLPQAVQVDGGTHVAISFEGVSLPARGGVSAAVKAEAIEGMAVRLPFKSDG